MRNHVCRGPATKEGDDLIRRSFIDRLFVPYRPAGGKFGDRSPAIRCPFARARRRPGHSPASGASLSNDRFYFSRKRVCYHASRCGNKAAWPAQATGRDCAIRAVTAGFLDFQEQIGENQKAWIMSIPALRVQGCIHQRMLVHTGRSQHCDDVGNSWVDNFDKAEGRPLILNFAVNYTL
ncbi:hypothetical protein LGH82_28260 [Mesorhizobium sp. PAMC28654]|uniref:hypothetical protein n=1 Tax=Mesorhizobium sp. PAMC28654 TaxID=2880934 RepID=UPI001D0A8FBC|nr:hypothetical protein [Mesorhizobium sp. PAMC28654]UDL88951.1 hypothetical protein LGH82_28260 [Mesorhizobium sp. PAMC28654]